MIVSFKRNKLPEYHLRHDKVEWGPIISKAHRLDIVVFYYDHWVREHHDDFVKFFKNGGTLNLTVSDPDDLDLMATVQKHFFEKHTPAVLSHHVKATEESFRAALKQAGSKHASVNVHHFPAVLHYSYIMVDERTLYLSVYEQFRGPTVRSPVFEINLWKPRDAGAYWLDVRNKFLCGTRQRSAAQRNGAHSHPPA